MTETSPTTTKLRLRGPTRKKKRELKRGMGQSKKVANEASKRMPSLNFKYIKHPKAKGNPFYGIVRDMRNNGISLSTQSVQEAVEKVRESYLSKIENKKYNTVPKFKGNFVRFHNQQIKFFKKNRTFYVELKLFPYEKLVIPFFKGDYQDYFLERIINGDLDYGSGEIVKYKDYYSLNLTVKKEVDIDYEPQTFIGVDLGLNMVYWAVALDESKNFLNEIHLSGGEAGWVRNRLYKKRKRLQREGALKMVRRIKNREERWVENLNHNASKRIVEFASEFDKPIIILERINGREIRKRTKNPILHSWTHGKLRDFIKYKAVEKGIQTTEKNPKNTSRKCPKCGYVDEKNRDGIDFKCLNCGYSNHSDFVGGWNLAICNFSPT